MNQEKKQAIRDFLTQRVGDCRLLVFGDVMLDRYFTGEVTRISPEAPVPVNRVEGQRDTLGGAANVAHNLARLGAQVTLAGYIGKDHHGRVFQRQLRALGINDSCLYQGHRRTTTKIRILGGHQQMLRLDFEETEPVEAEVGRTLLLQIRTAIQKGVQAVIISDYGKGLCTDQMCQAIIACARQQNVPVLVDPKGTHWEKYRGAAYITPNVKEAATVLGHNLPNEDAPLAEAAATISSRYGIEHVMITRSERGISLYGSGRAYSVPTMAQEVFDVSGAGDTVIATFAAAITAGLPTTTAVDLANYVAGLEVGHLGTYAVTREEVLRALARDERLHSEA